MNGLWLQLNDTELAALRSALEGGDDPDQIALLNRIKDIADSPAREHDEAFRDAAFGKYAGKLDDGDIDFQHDGLVSYGDRGAYVMAFLYVRNEEAGFELEDKEEDPEGIKL